MSDSKPQPPAVIAEINYQNGYQALVDAMRARAQERKIAITSPHVAAMANLPEYYICKLLSVHPVRRIVMISLGPLLGVLGMKLIAVPDESAVARYSGKLEKRNESCIHTGTMEWRISRHAFRKMQNKGRRSHWDNMTLKQRSAWARKLNRIRWAKAAAKAAKRRAPAQAAKAA